MLKEFNKNEIIISTGGDSNYKLLTVAASYLFEKCVWHSKEKKVISLLFS